MKRTVNAVKTKILNIPENVNSSVIAQSPDAEISKQLQKKFQDSTISRSLKVTPSTILPKSCSILKLQEGFTAASNYMIIRTQELPKDQGIMMSIPNQVKL
jgi:hypothetical protein